MDTLILTSVRLFGEALERWLAACPDVSVVATTYDLNELSAIFSRCAVDVVLIDVSDQIELQTLRNIAIDHPAVAFIALGLAERRDQVIRAGRNGFTGYVARDASLDELVAVMRSALAGRLQCSGEIASGLLRALFEGSPAASPPPASYASGATDHGLTPREVEVARLVSRGCSNKEIARDLGLSVPTVKHHVHGILAKLNLARRSDVLRKLRDIPWVLADGDRPAVRRKVRR